MPNMAQAPKTRAGTQDRLNGSCMWIQPSKGSAGPWPVRRVLTGDPRPNALGSLISEPPMSFPLLADCENEETRLLVRPDGIIEGLPFSSRWEESSTTRIIEGLRPRIGPSG